MDENSIKKHKKIKKFDQTEKKSKKEIIKKDKGKVEKKKEKEEASDERRMQQLMKLGEYQKIVPVYVDLTSRNGHLFSDWRKHRKSCYIGKNLSKYDKSSLKETCKGRSPWENRFYGQSNALVKYETYIRKNRMTQLKQLYGKQCGCWCAKQDQDCHFHILKKLVIERLLQMKKIEEQNDKYPEKEEREILCMRKALKFASHKTFNFEKKVEIEHSETSDDPQDDVECDDDSESSDNENLNSPSENESEKESD